MRADAHVRLGTQFAFVLQANQTAPHAMKTVLDAKSLQATAIRNASAAAELGQRRRDHGSSGHGGARPLDQRCPAPAFIVRRGGVELLLI